MAYISNYTYDEITIGQTATYSKRIDARDIQLFAAVSGGGNLVMHAAGWLEGGLCSSFEKFVIDVEMLQNMVAYLEPVRIDAETLSFGEIAAVLRLRAFEATSASSKNLRLACAQHAASVIGPGLRSAW